jgi:hypothetical protein
MTSKDRKQTERMNMPISHELTATNDSSGPGGGCIYTTQTVHIPSYGLDDRGSVPGRYPSLPLCLDRPGAHPASYPVSTGNSYPGIKAAE